MEANWALFVAIGPYLGPNNVQKIITWALFLAIGPDLSPNNVQKNNYLGLGLNKNVWA